MIFVYCADFAERKKKVESHAVIRNQDPKMSAKELFAALLSTDNNVRSEAEVRLKKKLLKNFVKMLEIA